MITLLALTGEVAWVDDIDSDLVNLVWYFCKDKFATNINGKMKDLSRIIGDRIGIPENLLVDHKDQNRLNNYRSNL